jgi:hypothetical protein
MSGDGIVVGAPDADPGGTTGAGAGYIFRKPGGGWVGNLTEQARLIAPDKATGDSWGWSVAISGATVVLGAVVADPGGTADAGAALVFGPRDSYLPLLVK